MSIPVCMKEWLTGKLQCRCYWWWRKRSQQEVLHAVFWYNSRILLLGEISYSADMTHTEPHPLHPWRADWPPAGSLIKHDGGYKKRQKVTTFRPASTISQLPRRKEVIDWLKALVETEDERWRDSTAPRSHRSPHRLNIWTLRGELGGSEAAGFRRSSLNSELSPQAVEVQLQLLKPGAHTCDFGNRGTAVEVRRGKKEQKSK